MINVAISTYFNPCVRTTAQLCSELMMILCFYDYALCAAVQLGPRYLIFDRLVWKSLQQQQQRAASQQALT
jgi:hypothetical protein